MRHRRPASQITLARRLPPFSCGHHPCPTTPQSQYSDASRATHPFKQEPRRRQPPPHQRGRGGRHAIQQMRMAKLPPTHPKRTTLLPGPPTGPRTPARNSDTTRIQRQPPGPTHLLGAPPRIRTSSELSKMRQTHNRQGRLGPRAHGRPHSMDRARTRALQPQSRPGQQRQNARTLDLTDTNRPATAADSGARTRETTTTPRQQARRRNTNPKRPQARRSRTPSRPPGGCPLPHPLRTAGEVARKCGGFKHPRTGR